MTAPPVVFQARYDEDDPGYYCLSHRSVFCPHVIEEIEARNDSNAITDTINKSMSGGKLTGEKFYISLPIYPDMCVWETLTYAPVFHDVLGPMGELAGKIGERHQVIQRLLPGEGAGDLAFTLRQNFEDDDDVQTSIEALKRQRVTVGRPMSIPRCTSNTHSMKYQTLINEMLNPRTLSDNWDDLRDQTYAVMWTYHHFRQCVFCWTKRNMADAIRVAPDFAVEPPADANFDDLVPSPAPSRRDGGVTHPGSPY